MTGVAGFAAVAGAAAPTAPLVVGVARAGTGTCVVILFTVAVVADDDTCTELSCK